MNNTPCENCEYHGTIDKPWYSVNPHPCSNCINFQSQYIQKKNNFIDKHHKPLNIN